MFPFISVHVPLSVLFKSPAEDAALKVLEPFQSHFGQLDAGGPEQRFGLGALRLGGGHPEQPEAERHTLEQKIEGHVADGCWDLNFLPTSGFSVLNH